MRGRPAGRDRRPSAGRTGAKGAGTWRCSSTVDPMARPIPVAPAKGDTTEAMPPTRPAPPPPLPRPLFQATRTPRSASSAPSTTIPSAKLCLDFGNGSCDHRSDIMCLGYHMQTRYRMHGAFVTSPLRT